MIVVDTNIIAYYWLPGESTPLAETVRRKAPEWHAPLLWRSEMRSVLTQYLRRGIYTLGQVTEVMSHAESFLADYEYQCDSQSVLRLAASSRCSAYDCEFVALARDLGIPLITEDALVLKSFPDTAKTMQAFLEMH